MTTRHPDRDTLLAAVVDFLDGELYARLEGADRYRCRVAVNALRIVQRELALADTLAAADAADLRELLGTGAGGDSPHDWLVDAIEQGRQRLDDPALVAYLTRATGRALQINNPKWIEAAPPAPTTRPG